MATLVAAQRSTNELIVGLLTALPFVGLLAGSLLMPRVLVRTRHVRLIALATAGCGLTLLFLPRIESIIVWSLLRFAYGFFAAGVWLCCDTWMADLAPAHQRGKTLAIYQVIVLSGTALGQVLLVTIGDFVDLGFNIATAALMAAVIPVCCTKLAEPSVETTTKKLSVVMAWRLAPLPLLGAFMAGLCFSNYALILLSFTKQGAQPNELATVGVAMLAAGIFGQLGIGYLSDRLGNRRRILQVIVAICILALIPMALLGHSVWSVTVVFSCIYGGLLVTTYPLSIAIGGDLISQDNFQPFAAKAFLAIQTGNAVGPLIGSVFLSFSYLFGPFLFLATVLTALLAATFSSRFLAMHEPAVMGEFAPMGLAGVNPEITDPRVAPPLATEPEQVTQVDPQQPTS